MAGDSAARRRDCLWIREIMAGELYTATALYLEEFSMESVGQALVTTFKVPVQCVNFLGLP